MIEFVVQGLFIAIWLGFFIFVVLKQPGRQDAWGPAGGGQRDGRDVAWGGGLFGSYPLGPREGYPTAEGREIVLRSLRGWPFSWAGSRALFQLAPWALGLETRFTGEIPTAVEG